MFTVKYLNTRFINGWKILFPALMFETNKQTGQNQTKEKEKKMYAISCVKFSCTFFYDDESWYLLTLCDIMEGSHQEGKYLSCQVAASAVHMYCADL